MTPQAVKLVCPQNYLCFCRVTHFQIAPNPSRGMHHEMQPMLTSQIHADTHTTIYGLPLVKSHFTNYYNCVKSVLGDLHVPQDDIRVVVFLNYSNVILKCLYVNKIMYLYVAIFANIRP